MAENIRELLQAARAVAQEGLSPGTSGNLSLRDGEGFWITPSGMPFGLLDSEDLCRVRFHEGQPSGGKRRTSTEWRLHWAIYQARGDVGAVVHTHSRFATALAVAGVPLPLIHYQIARLGQGVPLAPYATFGSEGLARSVVETLQAGGAVLLQNHGLVTVGASMAEALTAARDVEWVAELYCLAQRIGSPRVLSEADRQAVLKNWQDYGQPKD